MMRFNKKLVVSVFLALIILSAAPKGASAAVPVFETNPFAMSEPVPIAGWDQLLLLAVEALKRQLLNMIVDQIVAYIQGGGTPKFITDWPAFFQDAVDQAGGRFLQQLGLGLFCSPYNPTLRAAFIPIPQFSDRVACTFSQAGVNLDNFLQDFNQGGWVAWNEMILKPQNNIYGAYLIAWDEYEREKSAAQKAAESEAQAGRGFLSVRDKNGQIITPGAVVGDLAAKAVGSDIDYIVNAQDFAAYVVAIANAILNRIFAEGVGLLNAAPSKSVAPPPEPPPGQPYPDGPHVCDCSIPTQPGFPPFKRFLCLPNCSASFCGDTGQTCTPP